MTRQVGGPEYDHVHTYDDEGKITCCSLEEEIYHQADAEELLHPVHKAEEDDDREHVQPVLNPYQEYIAPAISLIMLLLGISADIWWDFFQGPFRLAWYLIAYAPVAFPVIRHGWVALKKGEFFTEFTLMTIATVGAFGIGQYPEAVAVMLFYAIGELFQSAAVRKAKNSIKTLLDLRPAVASVLRNNSYHNVKPKNVHIGETIQIKPGEKVPLDGTLLSEVSSFNTADLTGESKPVDMFRGEEVLAGMLNLDKVVELSVKRTFDDSAFSKILNLVQNANARKAKTELLIRKLAKVYTPVVFFLAVALVVIPFFIVADYEFRDWLYRALIFLVISCPCALVISIPLGYFGGIGSASRNGILFKGANYLDIITRVNTVVIDKTGTLTEGVFEVKEIISDNIDKGDLIKILASLESKSTHPVAKAIVSFHGKGSSHYSVENVEEISGLGLKGKVNDYTVLAGNLKLLDKYDIPFPEAIRYIDETTIVVAINNKFAGYVLIADTIKEDARETIRQLHQLGIREVIMLSGDKSAIADRVARKVGIDVSFGDLLPQDKMAKMEELKRDPAKIIAFVGDGINDAPALALSDVGIAMGAMGSDAAIETADVVIQTHHTSRIVSAIRVGRATRNIVIQNIFLAFGVKLIVMILGAYGVATMWEAVFADVGVALLAILNAVRLQRMSFD